ncbi:DUF4129 domain-containing protein [Amnibacterium sp. CER49]|uniref:DUF4129 domain-containing protein n=1 Tax=Amnibacterium sp. CER49 TaxID=3039161 RepID=UPI002446E5B7|nr:DUF4129 domain-containing protein [Amnibacterium sp. CER49]MDH2444017.1 DUF4129 domain-containing protein [Amnibacterium sp. CER49]
MPETLAAARAGGGSRVRALLSGRVLVPLAVLVGVAVVVLAALLAGPPTMRGADGPPHALPAVPRLPGATRRPIPFDPVSPVISTVFLTLLGLLLAIPLLLLLVVLLRALLEGLTRLRRRPRTPPLEGGSSVEAAETVDAPAVRRGIRAALAVLAEDREPGDAVVRAWLGVQQTAEESGLARSPAETPTEFAVRVLARSSADEPAVRTLLGLYLRARFDDAPVAPADAAAAREALTAIGDSWRAEPARAAR